MLKKLQNWLMGDEAMIDTWLHACRVGNSERIHQMLSAGFNPLVQDKEGRNGITYASRTRSCNTVEILLPHFQKRLAHKDLVKALSVPYGSHEMAKTPLEMYQSSTQPDCARVVSMLEKAFKNPILLVDPQQAHEDTQAGRFNTEEWFKACRIGDEETIKKMLKAGIDPTVEDEYGRNGITHASRACVGSTVAILLPLFEAWLEPDELIRKLNIPYEKGGETPRALFGFRGDPAAKDIRKAIEDALEKQKEGGFASKVKKQATPEPAKPETIAAEETRSVEESIHPKITAEELAASVNGTTLMQQICQEGKLSALFDDDIWFGRMDEMMKAWQLVPALYQDEVNIELVQGKLTRESIVKKYNRRDPSQSSDIEIGF